MSQSAELFDFSALDDGADPDGAIVDCAICIAMFLRLLHKEPPPLRQSNFESDDDILRLGL